MSSSQSPTPNDDHSTADVTEPQSTPVQSSQEQVEPSSEPPRRPQAEVRSIQVIGQTTIESPSPQTNTDAQPLQHIPVVFIKQEPVDDEQDLQCLLSGNSHLEGHPQRQNAFIIHTGPVDQSAGQSPSPLQLLERSVIQLSDSPPSNPTSAQSVEEGSKAGERTQASSSNQASTAGTQTTAVPQPRTQTTRTSSGSQQGGQTPSVSQTPQSQTGTTATQRGRPPKETQTIQEMALRTLSRYTTDYKTGKTYKMNEYNLCPARYGTTPLTQTRLTRTPR